MGKNFVITDIRDRDTLDAVLHNGGEDGWNKVDSKKGKHLQVTVIIPTLNEEKNLHHVLPMISAIADEVLLIDGHSTDNTIGVARSLCPGITIIYQEGKGKGSALREGIAKATGDIIVTIDADGSMGPEEVPGFIEPLLKGYDFVKGSRFLEGGRTQDMPWYRRLGNRLFTATVNLLFGVKYTDLCYGYNAFWKKAIDLIKLKSAGFEIETEMHIKAGKAKLKVIEIPSFERKRLNGNGKLKTARDGWKIIKTILSEKFAG